MIESAGAFSSSTSQETEDTMLLSPSEMAIMGMVADGVMVGGVGTVAVGMVAGMVGGGMATGMEVCIAACMVMVGTVQVQWWRKEACLLRLWNQWEGDWVWD